MINKRKIRYIVFMVLLCFTIGCGKEESVTETMLGDRSTEETNLEYSGEDVLTTEEDTEKMIVKATTEEIRIPEELTILKEAILSWIQSERNEGVTVSVEVEDLTNGNYVSLSSGQQKSASLIKLYVAGCVYENMEKLEATESYVGETEDLIQDMITVSDNDATNTLVTKLGHGDSNAGMVCVNEYCQSHGFSETYMGRLMLDFSSTSDNYTSVKDCAHFLSAIYYHELAGSDNIILYMEQQERTGKIPAGVPDDVKTANKTGELADVENDVAFVFAEEGTYIVCIMVSGLQDASHGRSIIIGLSEIIYEYLRK